MRFDSGEDVSASGRVLWGRSRRSGWVRAGQYKKAERNAEALSVVQVHHSVWHLLRIFSVAGEEEGPSGLASACFLGIRGPPEGEEGQVFVCSNKTDSLYDG